MKKSASLYLVPCALRVAVVGLLCLCGCGREGSEGLETGAEEAKAQKESFKKAMSGQVAERKNLAKMRHELVTKMESMVDAMKAKMPSADDAAIKAELEKSAEWVSLYKKVVDINTAIGDNQRKSAKIVGRNMKANKEISK